MVGLLCSVIIFNFIAYKVNKRLTLSQIVQIWTFTIAFQMLFDLIVEFKYHSYWYFSRGVDWSGLIPRILLIPPVNIIFLNYFPFTKSTLKKLFYVVVFVVFIGLYELATLLPEPWGYLNYGWWKIWYSLLMDPILLSCLLLFYKFIIWVENRSHV
jgi:hypothetical protein